MDNIFKYTLFFTLPLKVFHIDELQQTFRGTMKREMGLPNSSLLQEAEVKIKTAIEKEKDAQNCLQMV